MVVEAMWLCQQHEKLDMGASILSETDVLFQVEVVLDPNKMQFPGILEFIYLSFLLRVPAPFSQSNVRSFSRKKKIRKFKTYSVLSCVAN